MASRRSSDALRTENARRRIAVEAARLIGESGLRDYSHAKNRAAERLGILEKSALPSNLEIEDALREQHRLFGGAAHSRRLRRLREAARDAMSFFSTHEPRLVGAVLEGTADEHSAICLHLYSDHPDAIANRLREHSIPWEAQSRRLRLDRAKSGQFPALVFRAGDAVIDLTILPYDLLRQAPLDRISAKPMQRAALGTLETLLLEDTDKDT